MAFRFPQPFALTEAVFLLFSNFPEELPFTFEASPGFNHICCPFFFFPPPPQFYSCRALSFFSLSRIIGLVDSANLPSPLWVLLEERTMELPLLVSVSPPDFVRGLQISFPRWKEADRRVLALWHPGMSVAGTRTRSARQPPWSPRSPAISFPDDLFRFLVT